MSRSSTPSDSAVRATTASSTRAAATHLQQQVLCTSTSPAASIQRCAACAAPLQGVTRPRCKEKQQFKLLLPPAKPPPHGRAL